MQINLSGLASGFDWNSFINQMVAAEQQGETPYKTQQSTISQQTSAYTDLKTELGTLSTQLTNLTKGSFFATQTAQSSNTAVATASSAGGAAVGQYLFNITQMATSAVQQGTADIGGKLNSSNDVSSLLATNAPLATPITTGTFTVNGKQVTIAATDTLQNVFDNISTATAGAVTASYDSSTDKITLSGSGEIILGSATDTSNFLGAAKLSNNRTGAITSSAALGAVRLGGSLADANLATTISDGGSGAGQFTINGVAISYSATSDSLADVINRINNSGAGVTASYDTLSDRMVLTSNATGDIGIGLQDITGNFLAATGLTGGQFQHGADLQYTINNGGQLISHSNTISSDSSGLAGLTVTATGKGLATVSVASDNTTIKQAITDFVTEYNKVQSLIAADTASTTDAQGKVTAGILANDSEAEGIASRLRSLVNSVDPALTGAVKSLNDLGIVSNGYDSTLQISDSSKLDAALANHLSDVQALFSDATNGLAANISNYLTQTTGDSGSLTARQNNLTQQSKNLDTQIANMEKTIQADKQRMITEFTAMEQAQAKINQELTYLSQFGVSLGSSSSSSSSSKSSSG